MGKHSPKTSGGTFFQRTRAGASSCFTNGFRRHTLSGLLRLTTSQKLIVARAYRLAVNALGSNLGAAPLLDRVVQCHDQRAFRYECLDQQRKQAPAPCQRRPFDTVQHPVIFLELPLLRQAHDARNTALTLRDPTAKIAPANNTCTSGQARSENTSVSPTMALVSPDEIVATINLPARIGQSMTIHSGLPFLRSCLANGQSRA